MEKRKVSASVENFYENFNQFCWLFCIHAFSSYNYNETFKVYLHLRYETRAIDFLSNRLALKWLQNTIRPPGRNQHSGIV